MGKVNFRQESPQAGIKYSIINIPDDSNLGTGSFTTVYEKAAVAKNEAIGSMMVNAPAFQISVTINPATKEVPALLGRADGANLNRKAFKLPVDLASKGDCAVVVDFEDWTIKSMTLNDEPLEEIV
ncbi:hypothetical protein [Pontibacter anaerobius]|uniref:Uncharacterized protein n=1 Tax=Pontibacter anaerobius TaxID=2993940 RepID=A0ABT3RKH8_9BACT|nr:hypothetical protein [Pontibacter anaerobius]MCX2741993.1 hypothetical protein [Pontibacter anaerobius]